MALVPLALLALLASFADPPATRPSAEALVARHVGATGGAEARRAVTSQRQTGVVRLPAMGGRPGFEGKVTVIVADPDRVRVSVEVPPVGTFEQGAVGDLGWANDPFNGPRVMDDVERRAALDAAEPADLDDPYAEFDAATVAGPEPVENVPGHDGPVQAHRVDLTGGPLDAEFSEWFAVETGLRIKRRVAWEGDFGDESAEVTYGDYRPAGDSELLVAHASRRVALGTPIEVQLTNIEVNPDLADDAFGPPPSVEDLRAR